MLSKKVDFRKTAAFAARNRKEILRDPTSLLFCVGFPVFLLVAFRLIQYNTGGMWMSSTELIPGVAIFSLSFDMLFMVLLVSRDRSSSFLARLYNSPMRLSDFILGYALPCFLVGVAQLVLTYLVGCVIFAIPDGAWAGGLVLTDTAASLLSFPPITVTVKTTVTAWNLLLSVIAGLPALCFFLFLGIFFGILLNERAAPGISSALITGAGFLGGCWMPMDTMGVFADVCRALPFYPSVLLSRAAFTGTGETGASFLSLAISLLWAILAFFLAFLAFRRTRTK